MYPLKDKDTIEILGIGEIRDMLNPELRNSNILNNLFIGADNDLIEDEPTFLEWFKSKGRFFIWIFSSLPVLVTAYVIAWTFKVEPLLSHFIRLPEKASASQTEADVLKERAAILQGELGIIILIVVSFVILYLVFSQPKLKIPRTNEFVNRAIESQKTILNYWFWVWVTWFLFYLILMLEWLSTGNNTIIKPILLPHGYSALENLFNNASAIFFFCIYYEMSRETKSNDRNNASTLPIPFILINGVLCLVEFFYLDPSTGLQQQKDIHFYFALFSGVCNGVTMGLFIARLESIILNTPPFLVVFFTIYAVIQPTSYFLTDNTRPALSIIIILLAFYGKILLFITLMWLKDTNRLIYYLVRWLYIYQQEIDLRLRGLFFKALKEEEKRLLGKNIPTNRLEEKVGIRGKFGTWETKNSSSKYEKLDHNEQIDSDLANSLTSEKENNDY